MIQKSKEDLCVIKNKGSLGSETDQIAIQICDQYLAACLLHK